MKDLMILLFFILLIIFVVLGQNYGFWDWVDGYKR